jgi:hypothetical protein
MKHQFRTANINMKVNTNMYLLFKSILEILQEARINNDESMINNSISTIFKILST